MTACSPGWPCCTRRGDASDPAVPTTNERASGEGDKSARAPNSSLVFEGTFCNIDHWAGDLHDKMALWSNGKQKDTNLTKVIVEGATQLANFGAAGDFGSDIISRATDSVCADVPAAPSVVWG